MGQGVQKENPRQLWDQYDADKSGVLDRTELRQMLSALWGGHKLQKELSPDVLDRIIQDLDHNGDGRIARQEFVDLYEQVWDIIAAEFGASGSSAPAASPGPAGGAPSAQQLVTAAPEHQLRCPYCAHAIDPSELDQLRVDPHAGGPAHVGAEGATPWGFRS